MDYFAYKPRKQTRAEESAFAEEASEAKDRVWKRISSERRAAKEASFKPQKRVSSNGDIAFVDHVLGSGRATLSRSQLDRKRYEASRNKRRRLASDDDGSDDDQAAVNDGIKSLRQIAVKTFADSWAENDMIEGLSFAHRLYAGDLLDALVNSKQKDPPWQVWLAVMSTTSAADVPRKRRTMRDVTLSDTKELEQLNLLNRQALERYAMSTSGLPSWTAPPTVFVLTVLDLRHDTTFHDSDMYLLRLIAESLAVLRLSYTNVGDRGVRSLVTLAGDEEHSFFRRLEVIQLRGLGKNLTDASAVHLARFPCLRMLDVRNTSCTSAFRDILNANNGPHKIAWRPARFQSGYKGNKINIELELFGKGYSSSRILTHLNELADSDRKRGLGPSFKPVTVCIDSVVRSRPVSPATTDATSTSMEGAYQHELGRMNGPVRAAFHQTYGALTCTNVLDSRAVQMSGAEEFQKGSAFRVLGENISAGSWIGHVRKPAATGTSDSTKDKGEQEQMHLEDWSDHSDDEADIAKHLERVEAAKKRDFYGQPPDRATKKLLLVGSSKPVEAIKPSPLALLRHLPAQHAHEPALPLAALRANKRPRTEDVKPIVDSGLTEGNLLVKKKVRSDTSDWKALSSSTTTLQATVKQAKGLGGLKRSFG